MITVTSTNVLDSFIQWLNDLKKRMVTRDPWGDEITIEELEASKEHASLMLESFVEQKIKEVISEIVADSKTSPKHDPNDHPLYRKDPYKFKI